MDDKRKLGSGREPRSPPKAAVGRETRADGGRAAATAPSQRAEKATVSHEQLRAQPPARPLRTPRPPLIPTIEDARPQGPAAEGGLAERMQQLRYLQDFFHNPVPFDLREKPIESSSTREEILQRIGEVQYQIAVLKALLVVLNEEMETLTQALPVETGERVEAPAQT